MLDVAAQIPVVVLKQAVPGQATLLPVHTGHKHTHTQMLNDADERTATPQATNLELVTYAFNWHHTR